jgi:hypothetical protein
MKTIVLIVIALAILAFILARRPAKPAKTAASRRTLSPKTVTAPASPYRASSIVFDFEACDAVRAIGDRRFLASDRDIPVLPLERCTAAKCNCKYVHHDDRRETSEDRRHPSGLQAELYDRSGEPNRRQKQRGRRKTDLS